MTYYTHRRDMDAPSLYTLMFLQALFTELLITHFTRIQILPTIFALMYLQIIMLDMDASQYICVNLSSE
jgi:hypothetical protein